MIDSRYIRSEIAEILEGSCLTKSSLDCLYKLYIVHDYMTGVGMSAARAKADEGWIDDWMEKLQNKDGTAGAHWTRQQTGDVMKSYGFKHDPDEFYAAMNMMYSDYYNVARNLGVDVVMMCAFLTDAFLADDDAVDGKLKAYYEYVVA